MSGILGLIVAIVLGVILIKVTFKLLGIAIAIAAGVFVYFVAHSLFAKKGA